MTDMLDTPSHYTKTDVHLGRRKVVVISCKCRLVLTTRLTTKSHASLGHSVWAAK